MNLNFFDLLHLLLKETWERKRIFAVLYLLTSAAFLLVGWNWPKEYSSSSTILVDETNILRPLMEGTAVPTSIVDRGKLAREIIFSQEVMDLTLRKFGWLKGDPSELEKERIISTIRDRTFVDKQSKNLIEIVYRDSEPRRAYQMTEFFTNEFISRSIKAKQSESRSAFEFINSQAEFYRNKLRAAENALKEFRSNNLDASPGTQSTVDMRIVDLRRRIEVTQLEMREAAIRRDTLRKQLSGEIAVTASLSREGQYSQRLAGLRNQLQELRLKYHDSYPDIVSIKGQIASIEEELRLEKEARLSGKQQESLNVVQSDNQENSLYQQLRSQLSATETQIATLEARLAETQDLLHKEEDRIIRINEVDARLAELNRDYDATQDRYNLLVRQRDTASISMQIDQENQGLTFKIQEPASLQLTPQGIRFMHFIAAGLVMSFAVPLGVLFGLTLLDQKVRIESVITETLSLPVLASVYHMNTPTEYNLNSMKKSVITLVVLTSWAAYGYAAWLRLQV